MARPKKPRNPPGTPRNYPDKVFLDVLTSNPQTTQQVRTALKQLECCAGISYDTVLTRLSGLAEEGKIIKQEIPAGTGTGLMFLWSRKD